jgi:hypothetical protein
MDIYSITHEGIQYVSGDVPNTQTGWYISRFAQTFSPINGQYLSYNIYIMPSTESGLTKIGMARQVLQEEEQTQIEEEVKTSERLWKTLIGNSFVIEYTVE